MHNIDIIVQNYFSLARTSSFTEYMYILSNFFDITGYSVALFFCFVFLIYLIRGKKYSLLFIITILVTTVSVYLLKIFFNVSRPIDGVISAFGQSFPSFHATISSVSFIMLMYVFDDYFSSFFRVLFNTICIVILFSVAFSRVYLGVHWVSDVASGVIFGGLISYVSILIFRKYS